MKIYLNEALKEARKAYKKKEVPVGAIIVKNNKIIAKAHNLRETKKNALAHAEMICIYKACKKLKSWRLEDCEMYITLSPCEMCLGAIKQSRISKVYCGAIDEKNKKMYKTEIIEYVPTEQCSKILKDFFKELRNK